MPSLNQIRNILRVTKGSLSNNRTFNIKNNAGDIFNKLLKTDELIKRAGIESYTRPEYAYNANGKPFKAITRITMSKDPNKKGLLLSENTIKTAQAKTPLQKFKALKPEIRKRLNQFNETTQDLGHNYKLSGFNINERKEDFLKKKKDFKKAMSELGLGKVNKLVKNTKHYYIYGDKYLKEV